MNLEKATNKKLIIENFINMIINKGWEEINILKADIENIHELSENSANEIENVLQDLVDSWLIAIGTLQNSTTHTIKQSIPENKIEKNESVAQKTPQTSIPLNMIEKKQNFSEVPSVKNVSENMISSGISTELTEDFNEFELGTLAMPTVQEDEDSNEYICDFSNIPASNNILNSLQESLEFVHKK